MNTLLVLLGSLAIAATIGGYWIKQTFVIIISAIFWFLFGAQCYVMSTAANDVYWITFFAAMFIGVVTLSGSLVVWRRGKAMVADYTDEYDDADEYQDEGESLREDIDKYKRLGRKKKTTYAFDDVAGTIKEKNKRKETLG